MRLDNKEHNNSYENIYKNDCEQNSGYWKLDMLEIENDFHEQINIYHTEQEILKNLEQKLNLESL